MLLRFIRSANKDPEHLTPEHMAQTSRHTVILSSYCRRIPGCAFINLLAIQTPKWYGTKQTNQYSTSYERTLTHWFCVLLFIPLSGCYFPLASGFISKLDFQVMRWIICNHNIRVWMDFSVVGNIVWWLRHRPKSTRSWDMSIFTVVYKSLVEERSFQPLSFFLRFTPALTSRYHESDPLPISRWPT